MHARLGAAAAIAAALLMATGAAAETTRGFNLAIKRSEERGAPDAGEVPLYGASYALVIGIDAYPGASGWPRLSNAVADGRVVAAALKAQGFAVEEAWNLDRRKLDEALETFFVTRGRDPDARLFVWFAGHGHTERGEGYLVPTDGVAPGHPEFRRRALSLRRFGEYVRQAESKHVLTVFDACFAGTIFEVSRSAVPPAVTMATTRPVRQFLSSGDAGQTVSDNGAFAKLFVRALAGDESADLNGDGYVTASELGMFLTDRVTNLTRERQTPRYGKLRDPDYDRGDFVFAVSGSAGSRRPAPPGPAPPSGRGADFGDIERDLAARRPWAERLTRMKADFGKATELERQVPTPAGKVDVWTRFLTGYGEDDPYSSEDDDLRAQGIARQEAARAEAARPPAPPGLVWKRIPGGCFDMGSEDGDDDEKPVRRVCVRDFELAETEVTNAQYAACVAAGRCTKPHYDAGTCQIRTGTTFGATGVVGPAFRGPDQPVVCVDWEQARAFAAWAGGRLPSEAEWELAARSGGRAQRYPWGDQAATCQHAVMDDGGDGCGREAPWPVKSKPGGVSAHGVYDLAGNVREWVQDAYFVDYGGSPTDGSAREGATNRVNRGGSWFGTSARVRSTFRNSDAPETAHSSLGLRPAR